MITLDMARKWYSENDAVHGFGHIQRVVALCGIIGPNEGADMRILVSAALLHDASGSHPAKGQRNAHHIHSAAFAKEILTEDRWESADIEAVQHCILTHRYRKNNPPISIEAKVLFDADKLDVIGAVGVVRVLSYAFQSEQPAYAEPSSQFLQSGEKLEGEPHSAYHEYIYKLKNISSLLFTDTARKFASQRQIFLNQFFEELRIESQGTHS